MGVYFLAAGSKSRSRDTLEHPTEMAVFEPVLTSDVLSRLRGCFDDGESIYVWGAMEAGQSALAQVQPGDYAVDVDGSDVVQIFEFGFSFDPTDTNLQEALGWTEGGAKPFTHVFLLRRPQIPRAGHRDKSYFQHVFAFDKANWLSRSRYFDQETLAAAISRTNVASLEDLLGIEPPRGDAEVTPKVDRAPPPDAPADSRQTKRQSLRDEVRSDWNNARVNLLDASTKLLELAKSQSLRDDVRRDWNSARINLRDASTKLLEVASRAMKKADERFRDRDS